jgi:hypothetical protein
MKESASFPGEIVIEIAKVGIHIFSAGVPMSDDALEEYAQKLKLVVIDQNMLAALYKTDPSFTNGRSVGTHYRDEKGKWHQFVLGSPPNINPSCYNKGIWSSKCWFIGIPISEILESAD